MSDLYAVVEFRQDAEPDRVVEIARSVADAQEIAAVLAEETQRHGQTNCRANAAPDPPNRR